MCIHLEPSLARLVTPVTPDTYRFNLMCACIITFRKSGSGPKRVLELAFPCSVRRLLNAA